MAINFNLSFIVSINSEKSNGNGYYIINSTNDFANISSIDSSTP